MAINLLLVDLGNPFNIGTIIRNSYVLGGENSTLFIFDPRNRIRDEIETVRISSLTLIDKIGSYNSIENIEKFLTDYNTNYGGRIIATDISPNAHPLPNFKFEENDLILLGNENRGYRDKQLNEYPGINLAHSKIMVPMLGDIFELPNRGSVVLNNHGDVLNLSVQAAANIVLYTALNQLGYFHNVDFNSLSNRNNPL